LSVSHPGHFTSRETELHLPFQVCEKRSNADSYALKEIAFHITVSPFEVVGQAMSGDNAHTSQFTEQYRNCITSSECTSSVISHSLHPSR